MNSRLVLPIVLVLALCIPVAAAVATPSGSDNTATIAKKKKKLSYCQKQGKKNKGKLFGKVKAAKFFLFTKKRPDEYFFCSESPKFTGGIEAWDGRKKTSHLRAVKNNCAIFYHETKKTGTGWDAGTKELKYVSAKYFRRGSKYPKQTNASRLGTKDQTVALKTLQLSKNCVFAAGYMLDGVPMLNIAGIGDFPYQGHFDARIAGATEADLKNIKIVYNSKTAVTVNYTAGGVAKTFDYSVEAREGKPGVSAF